MIRIHQSHNIKKSDNNSIIVVIDVLRAFSVTSAALECGVRNIYLLSTPEEAFSARMDIEQSVIAGELDGIKVQGFDHGNSPTEIINSKLKGKNLILRTTNGVMTVSNVIKKGEVLCASFRNALNTVKYIKGKLSQDSIDIELIATDRKGSDEDLACAEMIAEMIKSDSQVTPDQYLVRAQNSQNAHKYHDLAQPNFLMSDLMYCSELDPLAPATRCIIDSNTGKIKLQVIHNE